MQAFAQAAADVAIGAGVGVVGGLFGISGGVIAIPTLGLLGLSQQLAQGTSIVMQLPNVAIGVWQYTRRGTIDIRVAAALALGSLPFTFAGAYIATRMPSAPLRAAFGGFLLMLATYSLWNTLRRRGSAKPMLELSPPSASGIGVIGGFFTGLFGIGGAAIAVPSLTLLFGVVQTTAQGLALFLILPANVVGLITYAHAGDVDWRTGIGLAAGGALTVSAGVAMAHRLPDRVLRLLFSVLLYVVGTLLIVHH